MTESSLERLERWVQEVITHPEGVVPGAESEAARTLGSDIEGEILPSEALTAARRIAIYGNMYFGRLLEVLEEEFPGLSAVLGSDQFYRLMREYLIAHPSRHYSLNMLGVRLARYIGEERGDLPNSQFLSELATLERAIQEAFDGPACEPVSADELFAIAPDAWGGARLSTTPTLQLFTFEHPVNSWYREFREGRPGVTPEPASTWVAVYRRDYKVWRVSLTHVQFTILTAIHAGAPLGEALERGAALPDVDTAELGAGIGAWFQEWAGDGLFRAVALE